MGTSYDPTTYLNQQATTAPFVSREASAAERLRSSRILGNLKFPHGRLRRLSPKGIIPSAVTAHYSETLLTINIRSPILVNLFYPGVLTPFLSISMAFSNLFNRVSSFLASVIQRQYSLRCV